MVRTALKSKRCKEQSGDAPEAQRMVLPDGVLAGTEEEEEEAGGLREAVRVPEETRTTKLHPSSQPLVLR